ncbi:DUF6929 family protein [Usitatibacter palustris]|uniref:DUF3616 domain-containing protein n=1 Tax=Usitatibacter palustris TaxID=2732487 RepID=A0A6M4HBQ8_9PROT|nr:hypothetical protein [Usitatibacter palustris]QJR16258.1 hypothetical protein DSM104440_03087 [Usitatibacter palustris]
MTRKPPLILKRLRSLTLDEPSRPGALPHLSAASGLVRAGRRLYVVPDDENHLGVFPVAGRKPGKLTRLFEGKLPLGPAKRKKKKPDLESLVKLPAFGGFPHGALLALGSCSKENRCKAILMAIDAQGELDGEPAKVDLSAWYDGFERRLGRLNIEGAVVIGSELHLLQRGNKGGGRNARIRFRLDKVIKSLAKRQCLDMKPLIEIEEIDLGRIGDVPLCFSDGAALADGRMVFTAVAEDTCDAYEDGTCHGAAVGVLGRDGRVQLLETIGSRYKVEGIEAVKEGAVIHALMVTDADDASVPASLYGCEIRAPRRSK